MLEITYKVKDLYVKNVGTLENYVVNVLFAIEGKDGEEASSIHQSVSFTVDENKTDFVSFNELTEEVLIGWIKESMEDHRIKAIEGMLARAIEKAKEPISPISKVALPWS